MPRSTPAIVAHRGGAGLWPENSLKAFRGAVALSVEAVEFDVHLSADGEIVVIHDPTLERTTTGRGAVAALTYAEIAKAAIRGLGAPPEPPPRLAEVLAILAQAGVVAWIEIKAGADNRLYDGLEERVALAIRDATHADRTVITTFAWEALARLGRTDALITRSGNVSAEILRRHGDFEGCCRALAGLGARYVTPDHRLVSPADAAVAARHGLEMAVWTVNAEADLVRWLAADVAAVITDRPDRARRLRAQAGQHRP